VPELSGHDLVAEWRKALDSVAAAAGSVAGRAELPPQVSSAMHRQLELVGELIERERRLQKQAAAQLAAPFDALFDLLEQTGTTLQRQADALEAAGQAIEETAELMRGQAELFERTVGALRQPTDLAKAAAGLERRGSGAD
jgi:hypothetical protein